MYMNFKGWFIGGVVAGLVGVGLSVGFQLIVWGNSAPDWYAIPVVLVSMIFGVTGSIIGMNYGRR